MFYYLFASLLYASLAAPIFPWPRTRSVMLGIMHRLMHLTALTALVACVTFFVMPEWAPAWLLSLLSPLIRAFECLGPAGRPGFVWLPIGALVMVISVPILTIVDFAQSLSSLTAMVRRMLGDIRHAARELAEAMPKDSRARDPGTAERVDALKAAVHRIDGVPAGREQHPRRRQLVDLVSK